MNGIAFSKSITQLATQPHSMNAKTNLPEGSKTTLPSQNKWTAAIDNAMKGIDRSPQPSVKAFSQLMKVQTEINHYQLRVEMLSKLSESGLATIRKIQQTN